MLRDQTTPEPGEGIGDTPVSTPAQTETLQESSSHESRSATPSPELSSSHWVLGGSSIFSPRFVPASPTLPKVGISAQAVSSTRPAHFQECAKRDMGELPTDRPWKKAKVAPSTTKEPPLPAANPITSSFSQSYQWDQKLLQQQWDSQLEALQDRKRSLPEPERDPEPTFLERHRRFQGRVFLQQQRDLHRTLPERQQDAQQSLQGWQPDVEGGIQEGLHKDGSAQEEKSKEIRAEGFQPDRSCFIVVHAVVCHRTVKLYEDAPQYAVADRVVSDWAARNWGSSPSKHLEGKKSIPSIDSLMSSRPGLAFAAVRWYLCTHNSYVNNNGTCIYEGIRPLSRRLESDFKEISKWDSVTGNLPHQCDHKEHNFKGQQGWGTYPPCQLCEHPDINRLYNKTFMYHHQEALRDLTTRTWDHRKDILTLLWYLRREASFGSEFSQCDFDFSLGWFEPRLMEYLFCKHETLLDSSVNTLGEHEYLGVVLGNVVWPEKSAEVELRCWHWNYDSTRLLRQTKVLTIPIPKERMKIWDLPIYPLRFADMLIKDKLVLRGQQFWSLRYPTQVVYQGWDARQLINHAPNSRFMVDHHTYQLLNKSTNPFGPIITKEARDAHDPYPESVSNNTAFLKEGIALHLPAEVYAYPLQAVTYNWTPLKVSQLVPKKSDGAAWERVILSLEAKQTLLSAVRGRTVELRGVGAQHILPDNLPSMRQSVFHNSTWFDDMTPRPKSDPLMLHLHGLPNSAKMAAAAAALADLVGVPLLEIRPSQIVSGDRDGKLNTLVQRAGHAWNAILLLDEADVLVEDKLSGNTGVLAGWKRTHIIENSAQALAWALKQRYPGVVILTGAENDNLPSKFGGQTWVADFRDRANESNQHPPAGMGM